MPALFFGHGSPMNALGGPYANEWRALGAALPKPRAVLMVSAHWETEEIAVTAMERPRTIHDFYGFPPALYEQRYPAPGDPALAAQVAALLAPARVGQDQEWGLDHGTWSVLMHVFANADIPIVQLSLNRRLDGPAHYALARKLRPLRDDGVLIAGSGDVVHNLRLMHRTPDAAPCDWAERFHEDVKRRISAGDHAGLASFADLGPDAALSIPTPEHFLPLLYVLAQQDGPDEAATFFTDGLDLGAISMLGVRIG